MAADVMLIATLNDRAQPMHRGDLYEDPLQDKLQALGLGEVTGGGTQLTEAGEIDYCEVEIMVKPPLDAAVAQVKKLLKELGAPKGSKLSAEGLPADVPFGVNEGLAVYLNGTDLPDQVYQESDINFVIEESGRLLEGTGTLHSFWEGERETALYFYGPSFSAMQARLGSFLASYPLCQTCRVVQVA